MPSCSRRSVSRCLFRSACFAKRVPVNAPASRSACRSTQSFEASRHRRRPTGSMTWPYSPGRAREICGGRNGSALEERMFSGVYCPRQRPQLRPGSSSCRSPTHGVARERGPLMTTPPVSLERPGRLADRLRAGTSVKHDRGSSSCTERLRRWRPKVGSEALALAAQVRRGEAAHRAAAPRDLAGGDAAAA